MADAIVSVPTTYFGITACIPRITFYRSTGVRTPIATIALEDTTREFPVVVEEDAGRIFTLRFLDTSKDAATPNYVSYRVDCMSSNTNLVRDTSLNLLTQIEVPLTTAWTTMTDTLSDYELRRLAVTVAGEDYAKTQGEKWQHTTYKMFQVRNVKRFPIGAEACDGTTS